MNLAGYVKCLKRYALNKKISDEEFLNAVLKPYIDAGEVDNKYKEEIHFDKSRTSLILNRRDDVPTALRQALNANNIYPWTEENFKDFINEYLEPNSIEAAVKEISEMVEADQFIIDRSSLVGKMSDAHVFLADVMIECIKLKNDGFDPEGELLRNGAYCLKIVYKDIFKFHTQVTRKYEKRLLNEVAAASVHGQFLTRWEKSGEDIDCLQQRIRESLKVDSNECGRYPLGAIATIENDSTIFYLIAISDFDENNNAHSTKEEIIHCIDELSIFYDRYGDGHDIFIPLLGTGKSRAAVSLQESYDILVACYKKNPTRIQGNIYIVIRQDFEKYVKTGEGGN